MSIIPKESIAAVAEANGIQINDQVALSVSADVEYRLREIIVEAKKFMKHFKRSYLKPEDLNYALKVKNMEPMYGYNNWTPKMWKNTEHSGQQLFFLEDQEVDLDQIIHQKLPLVPLDVMYSSHWLAIEGVQPAIPQNPTPSEIAAMKDEFTVKLNPTPIIETSVEKKKDDKPSLVYNPMAKAKDKLVKDVLSKELILYYEKITHAILLIENKTTKAIKAGQVVIPSRSNMANGTQSNLLNLSRFKDECIDGVSKDPALQPLAPYFVEFLTQSVHENMKHVDILMNLMKFAKALLDNPNIFIEPYLHHLIPNVLTCTMAKKFSKSPKHWELRDYSAKLLGIIVKRHGAKYGDLSSRLSKKLIRCIFEVMVSSQEGSFEQGQGWSGCFGCVLGLAAISDYAVRALLLPKISLLGEAIEQDLKYGDKINDDAMEVDNEAAKPEKSGAEHEALKLRRAEAERCFDCVVNVIIPHVHEDLLKKNDIAVPTTDSKVNKNEKYLIKGLEADKKDEIVQKLMKDYGNVFAECLINRLGLD